MADNEDIVQRVKVIVDDSELNKSIAESKKLVSGLQKNINTNVPSVRVDYSQATKEFKQVAKESEAATKSVGKLSTAVTALSAATNVAAAKNLKGVADATKNLTTTTVQAVAAQKELNKATTAFVPLQRDPKTGRILPRGSKPPPQPPVEPTTAPTVVAKVPLQRDPNTGRILPRGVQAPPRIEKPVERFRDPATGRLLPRTLFGPPEFQGPRQPFGPPEAQGPRLPRFLPGDSRFIGPRRPDGPPEFQGPRRPPLPTDRNFIGPREFVGPRLPGTPPPIPINPGLALTAAFVGVVGSATALAASVAAVGLAFEKAGDTVAKTSQRLGSFTGGKEGGAAAFAGLKTLGNELKVSAVELAKPFEELVRSGQTPKGAENILRNITKGLQAEGITEDAGNNTLTKLLANVRTNGFLSAEELKAFKTFAPDTGKALQRAIEREDPGAVSRGIISSRTVQTAAGSAEFGKDAADRLDSAGEVVKTIPRAFEKLNAASERLAQAVTGGNAISGTITATASLLSGLATSIETLSPATKKIFSAAGKAAAGAVAGPIPKLLSDVFGESEEKKKETAAVKAAEKTAQTAADARLEKEGSVQKQLASQAARLSREQAKLNLDFLPQEQASQTDKNQLNVQRADIAVQQAQLGLKEADKQKALAALAPEQASNNLRGARFTLEQLQLKDQEKRLRASGADENDPNFQLNQQRQKQAQEAQEDLAIEQAKTAVKRAAIEKKFAFLEVPKAELAAQQAQTALRSAEIEKQDATLKLAKDEQGQPIDRDLAALRYAQAALENDQKTLQLQGEQLQTLQQILQALSGDKDITGRGKINELDQKDREKLASPGVGIDGQIFPNEDGNFPPPPGFENDPLFKKRSSAEDPATDELTKFASALTNATVATEKQNDVFQDTGTATGDTEEAFASLPAPLDDTATSADSLASSFDKLKSSLNTTSANAPTVEAATGGLLNGPGTGTSDSILARVSKGEFIVKAAATKHWGVDFLHSINRMRTPRFNVGGLVGLMSPRMPRYASGGPVDVPSSVNALSALGSVDLRTDHGTVTVMAGADAVKQLQKMAVTKRMTSTGKKPGFVG